MREFSHEGAEVTLEAIVRDPGRRHRHVLPLAGLSGVSLAAAGPGRRDLAGRLLDLLMDGLRPRRAG
ncbi:hypothetical protein [Micromonospora sp. 4G55]|uniref:hypothetical protein n=1 Tax=Micromonospora sp. 4G55 TaxID=2806102 RepID=UPI001EE4E0F1|nr:hypothetical protein [Micromonospora sp. 4G55]